MQTQTLRQNIETIQGDLLRNLQKNAVSFSETLIQKTKQINYGEIYERNAMFVGNALAKVKTFVAKLTNSSNGDYSSNIPSNKSSNKKLLILIGVIVVVVGFLGALSWMAGSGKNTLGVTDERPDATVAKKIVTLNKKFLFPVRDEKGKEVSAFEYQVTSAELYDNIIVKGQRARAVKGRVFLIFNLKITNNNKQGVEINTRDFLRINVNNNSELIAPDIHNDPVQVQAISTKYTRVGVAINETDKNIKLQVGEISGRKVDIKIDF